MSPEESSCCDARLWVAGGGWVWGAGRVGSTVIAGQVVEVGAQGRGESNHDIHDTIVESNHDRCRDWSVGWWRFRKGGREDEYGD
jgi:hypothetical protein